MDVAVDVDHVARAGLTVKPVDVLRQDPDAGKPLFDLCDEGMRAVERRVATSRFDLMNVLPCKRGLFRIVSQESTSSIGRSSCVSASSYNPPMPR